MYRLLPIFCLASVLSLAQNRPEFGPSLGANGISQPPNGLAPCGDGSHALGWTGITFSCQFINGGGVGLFVALAPSADQTISGAHRLTLSDAASSFLINGPVGIGPGSVPGGVGPISAVVVDSSILNVERTLTTGFSNLPTAIAIGLDWNGSADKNGGEMSGLFVYSETDPASTKNVNSAINGFLGEVDHRGSGTVNLMQGGGYGAFNFGSGTITLNQGADFESGGSSGTITNDHTIEIESPATGSTFTNPHAGLFIDDQTVGGLLANAYAIREIGNAQNDLGGGVTKAGNLLDSGLSANLPICTDGSSNLTTSGCSPITGITGGNPVQVTNPLAFAGPEPFADVTASLYGAKGDGQDNTNGSISSVTNTTRFTGSGFVSTDCNVSHGAGCTGTADKGIYIAGAGAAGVGLVTTIVGFTSSSVVTINTPALTTVASAFYIWGTDNATPFNTAFAANPEIWIPCASGQYYAVFSTVGLGTSGAKANNHKIHGAGAYDNRAVVNGCITQIAWGGLDGGTVLSFDATTHSTLDNVAIDGKSHAGRGLLETTLNSVQSTHRNVYSNLVISSIMGSPGYAIDVSGNFHIANQDVCCSTFEHITILGGFFQHNTASGNVGTCWHQDGTQTTLVTMQDLSCADFTSRGLDIEGGMAYVKGASFSSKQSGSNIDTIYIANTVLAAQFIDVYDEVTTTSDCATRHTVNLPSGSRLYPTTFVNLRTFWGPTCTSGAILATAQAGNVTLLGGSIEATSGTITSTFAQTTPGLVTINGTWFQPSHSVFSMAGKFNITGWVTTFANLPTCSAFVQGSSPVTVTDSTTNTWGATITSGAPNDVVVANCDGVNWTVMGK